MAEQEIGSTYIPSLYKPPSLLPIARHRDALLYLIETFPVTIVVGQTGSGKTTQIPQYLDQTGWASRDKCIAVTQVGESPVKDLFDPIEH
jgi:ATP-dependent RNA helicase DDX35